MPEDLWKCKNGDARSQGRDPEIRVDKPHREFTRAFTLVEVLVVVAITSMLIAILLPALSSARQNSRRLACQTNLRQISTAWNNYLDESEGNFLQGVNANLNYGGRQGQGSAAFCVPKPLNAQLQLPLVTSQGAEVFRCLADSGASAVRPSCFAYYGTSYGTNLLLIGQNQMPINPADPCRSILQQVNARLKDLRRSRISNESKLILIGDMGWTSAWNRYDSKRTEWHVKPYSHNLAFLDGHVEFIRMRKGLHVTDQYTIMPFADLADDALGCQREVATN